MGTKQNLYQILEIEFGFFLPPYEKCRVSFMKDLFSKKKLAVTQTEAKLFPVPRYKELGVKQIWEFIKEIPELMKYFPNFAEGEYPDRAFMWGVLGALRTDACKDLINKARMSRSTNNQENDNELIEIHPDFLDKLMKVPNMAKKRGRVAYLLKKSRPARIQRKEAKRYDANLNVFKRPREEEEEKKAPITPSLRRTNNEASMNVDSRSSLNQHRKEFFIGTPKKSEDRSSFNTDEYMKF